MNKRKIVKLKVANNISEKYLGKPFGDLNQDQRIKIYTFSNWIIGTSGLSLKDFENSIN